MPGLYLHVPFCDQACHYCNFHFSTNQTYKKKMVEMMCREMELQKSYLHTNQLETIYFGGGTPSQLEITDLEEILNQIKSQFTLSPNYEITLEANPDDLKKDYLKELKGLGINRLSIGIQSFNDTFLKFLNRNHTGKEAIEAFESAREIGFSNISLDLIYGIPHPDHSIFKEDLEKLLKFDAEHLSAYCLTIEPNTVFGNWATKGKLNPASDEFSAEQFEMLLNAVQIGGYEQYEISNFCKNEKYSRHNTSYWKDKHYLGIGPGAHSYNGISRQYNVCNNQLYIKDLEQSQLNFSIETLSEIDKFNEYLLTTLRTKWGCNILYLKEHFYFDWFSFENELRNAEKAEFLTIENNCIKLSDKGKLLADEITTRLMLHK